jgi:ERCC4-type nuclease
MPEPVFLNQAFDASRTYYRLGVEQLSSPRVIVDTREKPSGIPSILKSLGARVEFRLLDVADYVIGERAIERKTVEDFSSSLFSGRLFEQAGRLVESYADPILIVEGDLATHLQEVPRPRVYWGSMISLVMQYEIRAFFTPDREQTAELIFTYASQLSRRKPGYLPFIVKKPRISTDTQAQLLILESLPTIGPKLGSRLLERFGTVRRVFVASRSELAVRGGIGKARAQKVTALLDLPYRDSRVGGRQATLRPEE